MTKSKRSEKFKAKKSKKSEKNVKKCEVKKSEKIDLKFASWAHYGCPPPA
jgi:hypothetical protein